MADGGKALAGTHLRIGWWTVLVFLTLGALLEAFHALKAPLYVDAENETRRLMWTLAHAHGTLLGLLHIALAVTLTRLPGWGRSRAMASNCLKAATVLLPGGFLLGGVAVHGGDPGLGIVLVPLGALLLFVSVFQIARAASRRGD